MYGGVRTRSSVSVPSLPPSRGVALTGHELLRSPEEDVQRDSERVEVGIGELYMHAYGAEHGNERRSAN